MTVDANLVRVVFAGVLGAAAMALATLLFNALRVPVVDFGRLLATKVLRYHSHGTRLGLVLHMGNGIILALAYALLVEWWLKPLVPAFWMRGALYGIGLWLFLMMVVLPVVGDGFFGTRGRRGMIASALVVHVLYGLILGLAFRD